MERRSERTYSGHPGAVDIISFSFDMSGKNKGCTLDHLDGRFGYVTLQDAMDRNWRVFDYKTDKLQSTYGSVDELIEDGWKVST